MAQASKSPTILDLPSDILYEICSYLSYADLARCERVCKSFRSLREDSRLYTEVEFRKKQSKTFTLWLLRRASNPWTFRYCTTPFRRHRLQIDQLVGCVSQWKNLRVMHLTDVEFPTTYSFPQLRLTDLELHWCTVDHRTLDSLLENNKILAHLVLKNVLCNCGTCSPFWFCRISLKCLEASDSHLKNLTIWTGGSHLRDMHQISKFTNLRVLRIKEITLGHDSDQAASDLEAVARKCVKLEALEFTLLQYITDTILQSFFHTCPNLEILKLNSLDFISEASCLLAVRYLPRLRLLSVVGCPRIQMENEENIREASLGKNIKLEFY